MDILKDIENDVIDKSPEDLLNQLRKIIEKIFTKLNQIGIIPNEIIQNKGWINGSSLFLSGKHIDFIHNQDFIHPTIAEVIFRLLNITQDASHGEGDLRLKVDDYMKEMKSPYLYKSCVFQLLELLVWFKNFIDNNPDSDKNKLKWTKKEIGNIVTDGDWVTGKITRLAENGWGTFKPHSGTNTISIMPKMVKDYSLNVDDEVEIISEPSPDGSKTYITALKKVAE